MLSREEWLEERKNHIGASDVAAILGAHPARGPLSVYEAKVHGYCQDDNKWMKFGRDVEGAIANLYADETGREVRDLGATKIEYSLPFPFMGATLDRITWKDSSDGGLDPAPLELKHVGDFSRPDQWIENPPIHYQIQLQAQMACLGSQWGSLAGMFPGYQLAYKDIKRNDEFLEAAYPELEDFWRCVVDKTPPPVESHRDLDVVKRLYPSSSGETVALDNEIFDLACDWEFCNGAKKSAEKDAKELEAKLRAAMGDATWGALPDGTFLKLGTVKRKGYSVDPCEFRQLARTKAKK